jgi:PAS domain S-box-containing protein/diguanylate cyclase (GGDEF)-like protein
VVMMGQTVWRYELAEITASVAAPRILETTRGNIIVTDVRRQIRVISDATRILLGYTVDELVGKPLSLISEDLASIPIGDSNDRTPFLFENREAVWKTRTNERVDMVVSAALISDRRGRAAGILYSGEDISRRKKEEALRESEVRYRTLVESMREGVMLQNMDGVIQFVNQRMADMLGYVPHELVGKPVYSFINPSSHNKDGETTEMRRRVQMRTMMGRLLWVEVSEAPLTDGKGNVIGSIRVHTDVTDKHRAEVALFESESRYRLLAEFATDMISRHMPDGRLLYASPAARGILGYEPEELIGTRPAELIHPDDAFVLEKFRATLNNTGVTALSYRLRRKDGTYVWVESSWRPIRLQSSGDETEVVAVTRDISERKRAEQQIEHQAYHDVVTNLPNQRLLQDRFQVALAHALRQRTRGVPTAMAVLLIAARPARDKVGHGNLDWLLQSLSERFRACLRAEDSLARFRNEHFLVLLPDLEEGQGAAVVATKLLSVVEAPFAMGDDETVVNANIGVAVSPDDSDAFDVLVRNAEAAMVRARAAGPNTYQFFTSAALESPRVPEDPERERPRF